MPKSRKRARTDGAADGGEHRRESAHLLLHAPPATETASAPLIDPEGGDSLLAALAWPLSAADFLQQCFRRKAVATVAPAGSAALRPRTAAAAAALCGLDLEAMLTETASERLFVWMRGAAASADERVASFEVDEPRAAMICHEAGGSLYFRSPQAMVEPWVGRLGAELGLNFGAVYSQPQEELPQKGEIEVFATRAGHTTDWHMDFMENFTVQLSGRKRWRLAQSGLDGVIRGYTPHYQNVDNLEQQLKLHRMQRADFPAPRPWAEGAGDTDVVELGPGDVLYHPAGIWHRVECTEDSLSMNISLISTSWGDHLAEATRHALWRHTELRAPVVVRPSAYGAARAEAGARLAQAVARLGQLRGEDLMPPCMLLPRSESEWVVGRGKAGRRLLADEEGSADHESDEEEQEEQEGEEALLKRGEDGEDAARSERRWVRLNPLATLLRTEARDQRAQEDEQEDDVDESSDDNGEEEQEEQEEEQVSQAVQGKVYVCHVLFGNENVASTVETTIRVEACFAPYISPLSPPFRPWMPLLTRLCRAQVARCARGGGGSRVHGSRQGRAHRGCAAASVSALDIAQGRRRGGGD